MSTYKIIGFRNTGKTVSLIRRAAQLNAKMASRNPQYVKALAHQCGLGDIEVISYADLLTRGKKYDNVVIDEIEEFVRYIITNTGNLVGYTLSID